jgi:hypothetical protein
MSQVARTSKTLLRASAIVGVIGAMVVMGAAGIAGRAAYAADHPNLQPGNYETSTTMEIAGMPPRPAMTSNHCVRPDQVKDNQSLAERIQTSSKSKCKVSDIKVDGYKLSYSFACETGARATGTTELILGGTTYEGTTKISVPGRGNGPITGTQHFKSMRVGDC